ncbi:hypothetical protein Bealeia1_01603 [Candidatus Bealeia paramacronuclearis]|uniref:Lipoprotein n=1 Tax=Candidatus Bealeia paramacronuclearis TaxID=1921001 RepID=A0ABZ2C4J4_9PROT|nr:hypothetical protein [Candidatus Bealeia paramacronuclearis]
MLKHFLFLAITFSSFSACADLAFYADNQTKKTINISVQTLIGSCPLSSGWMDFKPQTKLTSPFYKTSFGMCSAEFLRPSKWVLYVDDYNDAQQNKEVNLGKNCVKAQVTIRDPGPKDKDGNPILDLECIDTAVQKSIRR